MQKLKKVLPIFNCAILVPGDMILKKIQIEVSYMLKHCAHYLIGCLRWVNFGLILSNVVDDGAECGTFHFSVGCKAC
jgi:hypothetical protein